MGWCPPRCTHGLKALAGSCKALARKMLCLAGPTLEAPLFGVTRGCNVPTTSNRRFARWGRGGGRAAGWAGCSQGQEGWRGWGQHPLCCHGAAMFGCSEGVGTAWSREAVGMGPGSELTLLQKGRRQGGAGCRWHLLHPGDSCRGESNRGNQQRILPDQWDTSQGD